MNALDAEFLRLATTGGGPDRRAYYARAVIRRGATVEGVAGLYGVTVADVKAMLREEE